MQWKELSALAREMAATPPSDRLHQTKIRLAVSTAYYAMYHQRLRAEEDPVVTYSAAETQGWIDRTEMAIAEFLSVDPGRRRAFALELLPVHLSEQ